MKTSHASNLMNYFRILGMERIAWSLRRIYIPVKPSDLVLEVGSGGNPYFRSNVLLDAYIETRERHFVPLVSDRKVVIGKVEDLPFKDKSFDFIIASHVLEHSSDPEKFLFELQRVGKAGYIEVPDAFMERLNPYIDHRLEITEIRNKLVIRKKKGPIVDNDLVKLYEPSAKDIIAIKTIPRFPFNFHVRFYWFNKIEFEVLNPEVDAGWPQIELNSEDMPNPGPTSTLKSAVLSAVRLLFSQTKRNKNIKLETLLRCLSCNGSIFEKISGSYICKNCSKAYEIDGEIIYTNGK